MTQTMVEAWVRRARAGDRDAARALYEAHVDATWGYCLAFARGDRATALDLLQETFAAAFASLGDLREPAAFPGWLRTTTRRTCLRWAERTRQERAALERLGREPTPGPPSGVDAARVVAEVIAACPDGDLRVAAELFYGDPPKSTGAIAGDLGVTQTAITTRLYRFRAWARTHMLARLAEALEAT